MRGTLDKCVNVVNCIELTALEKKNRALIVIMGLLSLTLSLPLATLNSQSSIS